MYNLLIFFELKEAGFLWVEIVIFINNENSYKGENHCNQKRTPKVSSSFIFQVFN